jgi:2-polyprenyl-3-methyl-5-hydroxy-6-metoxy-1,4-benzoquinol methylase
MIIEDLQKHYKKLYEQFGDTPQAVQYSDEASQNARFQALIEIADLEGKSILDFGCGAGHLGTYIERQGINCSYHGVDILEEFIDLCRNKFPNSKFGMIDSFDNERFDYIIISGVFNNKITDNRSFYQNTIKKLFKMCRHGIAFNLMSSYVDFFDENLFYEKPENVFSFMKTEVTQYVIIRNDYEVKKGVIPFDFTVYGYRR